MEKENYSEKLSGTFEGSRSGLSSNGKTIFSYIPSGKVITKMLKKMLKKMMKRKRK